MFRFAILVLLWSSFSAYCATDSVKKIIKEQVVAQPIEYSFQRLFNLVNLNYFLTLKQTNRVHSAKRGKGVALKIKNYQPNVKFSVIPIKALGGQRSLFEDNRLFPGTYKLVANKGTKLARMTVSKSFTLDYYQLLSVTGAKSDLSFGRLEVNSTPTAANIKITNYDLNYHRGMRLPVGEYDILVAKKGYSPTRKKIKIFKNQLSKLDVSLSILTPKPKTKLSATVPPVAKKTAAKKSLPVTQDNDAAVNIQEKLSKGKNETAIERITITGRLMPREALFNFEIKSRLRDRITLILSNGNEQPIEISQKTKAKRFDVRAKVLPGKYHATLSTRRHGDFDLGEVEVKNQVSNIFKYLLTLR
ncbi:hypothetical protein SAMN05216262_101566 [Colwellia chukchiensis]|uniref:PEGA domain-containing protein n=1 Tax=Colwellia chukchiensis TaxID=641665 RepID=A0A1H7HPX9_9GAMM|nr:hypothetical protein [Colwellia chukchiensis]SEK52329.1 hypothetical protein SAMN05216262_101566 [Colwellia chukchiensis]